MAVSFQAVGVLASNATTANVNLVAPTCAANDILIAAILGKNNQVMTPPDGTWTKFVELDNTSVQRITLAWRRAGASDSGAGFNFTKPVDDNLLNCGCISAWRGCITTATPIDATAPTTDVAASAADVVDYADFNPTETDAFVVAVGFYNEDLTTAGAISGTDPTFANNWDLETGTGSDGSIFGYSGSSSGVATGTRSHTTTSTVDAINVGVLFGLVAAPVLIPPRPTIRSFAATRAATY